VTYCGNREKRDRERNEIKNGERWWQHMMQILPNPRKISLSHLHFSIQYIFYSMLFLFLSHFHAAR
jgi:hypothetical protein